MFRLLVEELGCTLRRSAPLVGEAVDRRRRDAVEGGDRLILEEPLFDRTEELGNTSGQRDLVPVLTDETDSRRRQDLVQQL